MNYGHSWLREKIQLNTDTKGTHHGVCITALRKNITNQCCIDITRKADSTKRKKGRINLKGEGTITPAKSQGSETCVVGGRKPQKERKAETNAYAKFWRGNKEYYGIFEKRPIKWLQYKGQTCTRRETVLIHKNLSFFEQGTMSIKSMKRQTDPYGKAMKK